MRWFKSDFKKRGRLLLGIIPLLVLWHCGWLMPPWNLFEAAGRGDLERVRYFLDEGADIDERSVGITPLLQALRKRRIETATYLIEQGADVNFVDDLYKTPPIVYAAMFRDAELTRLMIAKGADVNARTGRGFDVKEGFTALIEAAYHGDVAIGRLLLEQGADPAATTAEGLTALNNARQRGHKDFEAMLVPFLASAAAAKEAETPVRLMPPLLLDEDSVYESARKRGTIEAYEGYLKRFANGKFEADAESALDKLYFDRALRSKTVEANQAYLDRFPQGRKADLARQRAEYLPLMNACLKLDLTTVDQLLLEGKTLTDRIEAATLIMQLQQQQTRSTIRMSEFEVKEMKGPSDIDRKFDYHVVMLLLYAGADPATLRIKGFEKAGRRDLGGGAYLYSSGDAGMIVPADEGGLSALEFAELNGLADFQKLLTGQVKIVPPHLRSKPAASAQDAGETGQQGVQEGESERLVRIGRLSFVLPDGFRPLSEADALAVKDQIEASENEVAQAFQNDTASALSPSSIESFQAFRLPDESGWVVAYVRRIAAQQHYLSRLETEQNRKIEWGLSQGRVRRVFSHGRVHINGCDIVKVDHEMQDGRRAVALYHWTAAEPDAVSQIAIVVQPGSYPLHAAAIENLIQSLQVR